MGYRIVDMDTVKNYVKPGYGCTRLMRDILVKVQHSQSTASDTYNVTFEVHDGFGLSISSIEREDNICESGDADTTEYTPTTETVEDLLFDHFDIQPDTRQGKDMKALTFTIQVIAGIAVLAISLAALAGLVLAIATYGMI